MSDGFAFAIIVALLGLAVIAFALSAYLTSAIIGVAVIAFMLYTTRRPPP